MVKSKSAVRLQAKSTRVSPSPIVSRDGHDDRAKTSRNLTSRREQEKKSVKTDKPFLKKSGSVATIHIRKDPERTTHNRVSIKTEISSKMNSVIREEEKPKKFKKK